MNRQLIVYNLVYTLRARECIAFDRYPGSALRGAFIEALAQRCCPQSAAYSCPPCPLGKLCPVANLVAPTQEAASRGQDLPRPLVLRPPLLEGEPAINHAIQQTSPAIMYEPGQRFTFGYVLIGNAARYFSTLALATRAMEEIGVGRPLQVNSGKRGRFDTERIEVVDPFTQQRAILFENGQPQVQPLSGAITALHVARRARMLPNEQLTLYFLTPTRLTENGTLVHVPEPGVLVRRLAERLDALTREYGVDTQETTIEDNSSDDPGDWHAVAKMSHCYLADCHVTWIDTKSHSSRQQRSLPIGGFLGKAMVRGSLSYQLRQLLVWGELLHVGKNTMKGAGWYQILPESSS